MNNQEQIISQILKPKLNQIRNEQLTNMLRCHICNNFYRFAHTLIDCGHTFCQLCLINYIKTYKGRFPSIKCPQCHATVDSNYRRSIFKDVYKQQLVDMLVPQFVEADKIIIHRLEQLFPEFDLSGLVDNFKFVTWDNISMKKDEKEETDSSKQSVAFLPDRIKEKFGISFQEFSEKIKNQEHFNKFLDCLKNPIKKESNIILIKAKTQRDFDFIGLQNQMKVGNMTVGKLQRFLEKQALSVIERTKMIPPEWITKEDQQLCCKIYLSMGDKVLENEDNIESLLGQQSERVIYYSLNCQ